MVLCYTSASRFSGTTIDRVMHAYEQGDATWSPRSHGLRDVAEAMAVALAAADAGAVGRLLSENWTHQQALDPHAHFGDGSAGAALCVAAGALGGKAAGSGAGGCMFFLAPGRSSGRCIEAARRAESGCSRCAGRRGACICADRRGADGAARH